MIKAGTTALLLLVFLLIASSKTYAKSPDEIKGLLDRTGVKDDICSSVIKPYVLSLTTECEIPNQKQEASNNLVKANATGGFYISHSFETATYTPTPTPIRVVSEIKLQEPVPTVVVSEQTVTPSGNDANRILEIINEHRLKIGKASFQKDEALCSLAQTRANELAGELSQGTLHSGLYNRGFSYRVIENAKTGGNEEETVRWWLNSYIHRKAIESDYVYSCGGCVGNNCSQLFTSYDPRNSQPTAMAN